MLLNHRRAQASAAPTTPEVEGNYLASASDLMIGLLFVFIILVVVLALEQRRQEAAFVATKDPRGEVVSSLGVALGPALGRSIQVDPSTGVISLPEELLFSLGKSTLQPEGEEALRKAAVALAEVLPCFVASQKTDNLLCPHNKVGHEIDTIFIEGHTDNRPINRPGYSNVNLSLDRAQAVHKVLVTDSSLNPYRNKLDQPLFSFSAYADSRPLAGIDPGDSRNRRVDLRIVMAYQPLDVLMNAAKHQLGN